MSYPKGQSPTTAFVLAAMTLVLLAESDSMAGEEAPGSPAELERMLEAGEAIIRTVSLHRPSDMERLHDAGLLVMTGEDAYAVVLGHCSQFEHLGLEHRAPREADHKMRRAAVWIEDASQIESVQQLVADLWPIERVPGFTEIRALDYQIRWLHDRGYEVVRRNPQAEQEEQDE